MGISFQIGPIGLNLQGTGKEIDLIQNEFYPVQTSANSSPDIKLQIGREQEFPIYNPTHLSGKSLMTFSRNTFFVGYSKTSNYRVNNAFANDSAMEVFIDCHKNILRKKMRRLLHQYTWPLYPEETIKEYSTTLNYSLFWYIYHLALLKKDAAFIHGGVLARKGKAVIFTGTGGCGKTSITLELMEDQRWSYLAEDYGVLDSNGVAHYVPKSISLYASDIAWRRRFTDELLNRLPTWDRIRWRVATRLLKRNPMIKANPLELFGKDRLQKTARIATVIYLSRETRHRIQLNSLPLTEIVRRSLEASSRELKTLSEILLLIHSNAPTDYCYPSVEALMEKTRKIYHRAFKDASLNILHVPHTAPPDEVTNYLINKGLLE